MSSQLLKAARKRCTQRKGALFQSLVAKGFKRVECPAQNNAYYFKDNGGSVLLVAHADTVQQGRRFSNKGGLYFSPMLDDRLGVAIVVDLLPKLTDVRFDILITDDEESANSSARSFEVDKEYNWIAEFDRGGDDVVTYWIESEEWIDALMSFGFKIGEGIYSDICDIQQSCCMVNIGIGYHKYHSKDAYAVVSEAEDNIARFIQMIEAVGDKKYEADVAQTKYETPLFDGLYSADYVCACCGSWSSEVVVDDFTGDVYCPHCLADVPDYVLMNRYAKEAYEKEWDELWTV